MLTDTHCRNAKPMVAGRSNHGHPASDNLLHPKNFAWRLGPDRRWRLAPAFDLTFSEGPMGQHHLDVCGEGAAIERRHLLRLAEEGGIPRKRAEEVIDRMLPQASSLGERFERAPIRQMLAQQIKSTIDACRWRLES